MSNIVKVPFVIFLWKKRTSNSAMCSCYVCLAHPILNKQRSIAYTTSAPPPAAPCEHHCPRWFSCAPLCFLFVSIIYLWVIYDIYEFIFVFFLFFNGCWRPCVSNCGFHFLPLPPNITNASFSLICISRLSVFVVLYMHFPSVLCSPLVFCISASWSYPDSFTWDFCY